MIERLKENHQRIAGLAGAGLGVMLVAALLVACINTPNPPTQEETSKVMAEEHHRVKLGDCLEHHLTYAERLGGSGERHSEFAIARCARVSRQYTDDALIDLGAEDWHDPDRTELRECKKQAWDYVEHHYPKIDAYNFVEAFYVRSICIPGKGTAY